VFANEVGNVCQTYGVDSHQVMNIFTQDTKLNISPAYLKPGFAFGGSCLGKDMRALLYAARQNDVRVPVLEAVLPSNQLQIQKALDMLLREGKRKIGVIGLSFKPNTDDLRESPTVELVERLIGKGFEPLIYDHKVSLSRLHGSNRAYIDQIIPHVGSLMQPSLEETVGPAEVVVITKSLSDDEREQLLGLLRPDQTLVDLVRLDGPKMGEFKGRYCGIAW
jgi:GDP-mannose 6-dehydrogenase